jgi:hypothetical protein
MTTPTEPHPWTANTSGAVEKRPKNASLRRERNDEHGATADLALAPRAEQIADGLRELVPAASSSDGPTIRLLSLVLARTEPNPPHRAAPLLETSWAEELAQPERCGMALRCCATVVARLMP